MGNLLQSFLESGRVSDLSLFPVEMITIKSVAFLELLVREGEWCCHCWCICGHVTGDDFVEETGMTTTIYERSTTILVWLYLIFLFFSFVSFNRVRIPRKNLLNRTADVTPAGKYVTPYKDPNKRFGASLGALSGGRVGITSMGVANLRSCIPIAIRYSNECDRCHPVGYVINIQCL